MRGGHKTWISGSRTSSSFGTTRCTGSWSKEVGRDYTRKHDESREWPDEAYRKFAAQDWLGLLLPEADGGRRSIAVMYAIFCEAIAKFSLDFAACLMTSMFTATNISTFGTPEQKARYLPAFLRGDQKFSISISEPGAGSDAAALITKARLDGDEWVINGNKTWCSGAHHPNTTIALMARTGEERYKGLSMFLVPNDTPGLEIHKLNTIVRRSLGTTQLFFGDARVPEGAIIGEAGRGWDYLGHHLALERLSLAASYVGNARTALDDTIRYTKERKQFGRSLSSFQVLKHRMAENECEVEAARLLVYSAATKLARGERCDQGGVDGQGVRRRRRLQGRVQRHAGPGRLLRSCRNTTWSGISARPSTAWSAAARARSSAASSPRRWGCDRGSWLPRQLEKPTRGARVGSPPLRRSEA